MTDDLVGRLRAYRPPNEWGDGVNHVICDEAAARIEALEADNKKLRADLVAHTDDATVDICVHCEARLFDGDDYVSCPSGESAGCWKAMTDIPPKRERPCFAYRVAQHLKQENAK